MVVYVIRIKALNSSSTYGKRVSSLALLGAPAGAQIPYRVLADGLHIGPVTKPAKVDHAFSFRLHLDGSVVGFVAFDRPDREQPTIRPGVRNTLRWLSGAGGDGSEVAIESWAHNKGAWQPIGTDQRPEGVSSGIPNTGSYEWETPQDIVAPLLLRIRAVGESSEIEHVVQMALAATTA
jgi:hypothetical protein